MKAIYVTRNRMTLVIYTLSFAQVFRGSELVKTCRGPWALRRALRWAVQTYKKGEQDND